MRFKGSDRRAGFTLIEVLVALSVLLAFAAVLGPNLFQSRRILSQGKGQIAAHLLLRSLIDAPFDRGAAGYRREEGENNGIRWRVTVEPQYLQTPAVENRPMPVADKPADPQKKAPNWAPYRVTAQVAWGNGQSASAETVRLGKAEEDNGR